MTEQNNKKPNDDNEEKNDKKNESNGVINGKHKIDKYDQSFMSKHVYQKEKNADDDISDDDELDRLEIGTLTHNELKKIYMEEDLIQKHCGSIPSSWSNADGVTFRVRVGPDYKPNSGQKKPSLSSLYNVFAVDAYKTQTKINKIWKYINIKKYIRKYKIFKYDPKIRLTLPPIIIINLMIPNYEPSMMGGASDGEGFQLVIYARLSESVISDLDKLKNNKIKYKDLKPSIQLFNNFLHSKKDSELRKRFKCIGKVMNPNKCNIPWAAQKLVNQYNGKPFLARTSSTFYHEPGNYFGCDIDGHLFGYLARRGLFYIKPGLDTVIFDGGFVIEGVSNDELPEQILCCMRGSKLGLSNAKLFKFNTSKIDNLLKNKKNKDILHYRDTHKTQDDNSNEGITGYMKSWYDWSTGNLKDKDQKS